MKKRKSYGTLMIDLIDGGIIDLIESREKEDVVIWLSLFPNIKCVSRDGSPTYAAAIRQFMMKEPRIRRDLKNGNTGGATEMIERK